MTDPNDRWYLTLTPEARERVFAVMRRVRDDADRNAATGRKLAPGYGEIAFGTQHVSANIRAEALNAFLAALGRGATPQDAAEAAKAEARTHAANWNRAPVRVACVAGQWENQVWDGATDASIEAAMRSVLRATDPAPEELKEFFLTPGPGGV